MRDRFTIYFITLMTTPTTLQQTPLDPSAWRFTVAPMLDWTDRHCRVFHRSLSKRARLYTEMVTTGAILFGNREKLLGFTDVEHPVALQLGGSDPEDLAKSVRIASDFGYDEYNLNCGCPSERVQKGSFGACLMKEPKLVAECWQAMAEVTDRPVTVKHRIGVDDDSSWDFVSNFVSTLYEVGCRVFVVHTRAAWLKGLSPKENREVPPLMRERAFELKKAFPDAVIVANGQIADVETAKGLIDGGLDGVMVGRAAYHNPWILTGVDETLFGDAAMEKSRYDVVLSMTEYLKAHCADDPLAIRATARHMIGLAQGLPGARAWRRELSDPAAFQAHGTDVLLNAWSKAFGEKLL